MKKLLPLLLLLPVYSFAQPVQAHVKIRFNIAIPTQYLYIAFDSEQRRDTIPFPADSVWTFDGQLSTAGHLSFSTDSLIAEDVWVDNVPVSLVYTEREIYKGRTELVTNNLQGSADCLLFDKRDKLGLGAYPPVSTLPGMKESYVDSIFSAEGARRSYQLVDSLLNAHPVSLVIPYYLYRWSSYLGADGLATLYNRLTQQAKDSRTGIRTKEKLDKLTLMKKGNTFEDFTVTDQHGKPLKLSNVKGKYILIDFWASWCGPCRGQNPGLRDAYNKFKEKGFEIISISLDDERQDWLDAIKEDQMTWLHVSDLKGWYGPLARQYKIESIPYQVLIDSNQKIIASNLYIDALRRLLNDLL
ncbi:MAG: TlpA disulfide reductase family protein [Chitinophagaceae bacterium]